MLKKVISTIVDATADLRVKCDKCGHLVQASQVVHEDGKHTCISCYRKLDVKEPV